VAVTPAPTQEVRSSIAKAEVPLGEAALEYAKRGWHVFPLKPRDKRPLTSNGFHGATSEVNKVLYSWQRNPEANIGLAPGASGLIVFDIDSAAAEQVAEALGLLDVGTLTACTGRADFNGRHIYFQHPGGRIGNLRLGLQNGRLVRVNSTTQGLEVKADAGYVVAPPSIHPSSRRYAFTDPVLEPATLPPSAVESLKSLMVRSNSALTATSLLTERHENGAAAEEPVPLLSGGSAPEPGISLADAERWLSGLAPHRSDEYQAWVSVLMALHHQFANSLDEPQALALAIEWSQESGKYQDGEVEDKWRSFSTGGTQQAITIRSLRHWAEQDNRDRADYPALDCTEASSVKLTSPAWRAIERRNQPTPLTFWSNGALAGLRPRSDGTLYVAPFTHDTLAQHLADNVADFYRLTQKGLKQCYPPLTLVKQIRANPAPPVELPRLSNVVPVPVFARHGELITTPGYHPASETYYAPPSWLSSVKHVSERPTPDETREAIRIFDEHIGANFPFDNDGGASRAHALALCLQGFVMGIVDQMAPLFDIEAAQRRTGKGLLTECCLMPAFGPTLAGKRTPMPKNDEEMTKVLTALFREGGPLIAFDNVKGTVDFPSFEAALTAECFEGRLLGSSTLIQARNRATWVMISNNPEMSSDLAGRAIRIRLISPVEYPEDRTDFERLQPAYTRERLPELIWAMHTIVRNWFAQGCPGPAPSTPGLGSYPRWRQVIGGILLAAGVEGFLGNRQTLRREVSRADMQWREFISDWLARFGSDPVPTGDLLALAEEHEIVLSGENDRAKATALGMRFGKCAGIRYFDRYTIEKCRKGSERHWMLLDCGASDANACVNT
jgi:hypothetical protein